MRRNKGFSRLDAMMSIGAGAVAICAVTVCAQPGMKIVPWKNFVPIASATAQYQNDHANRVPIVLTYKRGTVASATSGSFIGLCGWAWGGKNNNAWWATGFSSGFDVEAADRPLNPYLYPNHAFTAPTPPATLAANDSRRQEQAPINQDPFDKATHQRSWPQATPGVSCYNDVGTSYHFQFAWLNADQQIRQMWGGGQHVAAIAEANRRIAEHDRADPSRFVWLNDESVDIVSNQFDPNFKLTNGYGDVNKGAMLFVDGHVGYESLTPGVFTTARYTLTFE